ncbi:MAG: DUF4091 domain-containing protein [Sphaerochaeta sp.]|nr:DUF4091 domain-containing protein [Sphaerochaeta sp.]
MASYEFFLTSSLEKVFPDSRPKPLRTHLFSGLSNERLAFQLVYSVSDEIALDTQQEFVFSIEGCPVIPRIRSVELIPSHYPATHVRDRNYLRTDPGLFPDLLVPATGRIRPVANQYKSLWIDLDLEGAKSGSYALTVKVSADKYLTLVNEETKVPSSASRFDWQTALTLEVIDQRLPQQSLLHTEWFHADCIADYYGEEVFSEEYWRILENFMTFAAKESRVNMLLTPIFTPPLDTQIGGERTTVQLVGITRTEGEYSFDFAKLDRWCSICRKVGITHLEIAHFFTQWGAYATPKIMAIVDGVETMLFGWHVRATDLEYRTFLTSFVPSLLEALAQAGYEKQHLRFHISDEPNEAHLDSYLAAKAQVIDLLDGCIVMDALSSFEFYQKGIVTNPIPSNDHIQTFVDNKVEHLWVYYCVGQGKDVPNRFFSMPSARNRIMGVLLYLYAIEGFLQWGFNFYNSQYSKKHINPYVTTDCGQVFPSGDAFLVYPGDDGEVYSSIRNEVQVAAFQDVEAFTLLESLSDRGTVVSMIEEGVGYALSFTHYPWDEEYLFDLRARVNTKIVELSRT